MPRIARQKTGDSIYHVMCRSISEVDLFKDADDKKKYISILKKKKEVFRFQVYCYCFMQNHLHLIIDANGADISQIMHCVNFSYAQYFNQRHHRHGHLFQDRFKSKIIHSVNYLIAASAYIHNNPSAIHEYRKCPEKYEYSSLATYLHTTDDPFDLISKDYILSFFDGIDYKARKEYCKFVLKTNEDVLKEIEFENEGTRYSDCRVVIDRGHDPSEVIEYLASKLEISSKLLLTGKTHHLTNARAAMTLMLKSFCNMNTPTICRFIGNTSQSNVSRLVGIGISLIVKDERYCKIVNEFV